MYFFFQTCRPKKKWQTGTINSGTCKGCFICCLFLSGGISYETHNPGSDQYPTSAHFDKKHDVAAYFMIGKVEICTLIFLVCVEIQMSYKYMIEMLFCVYRDSL